MTKIEYVQLKQANEQLNRVEFEFADHYQGSSVSSNISLQDTAAEVAPSPAILGDAPQLLKICQGLEQVEGPPNQLEIVFERDRQSCARPAPPGRLSGWLAVGAH